MRLTGKEMQIMAVLWRSEHPMTSTEIVEVSKGDRTWKENSIYTLMNTLVKKGAAVQAKHKPTSTNLARTYKPALTPAEYAVLYITGIRKSGVDVNLKEFVDRLMENEEG